MSRKIKAMLISIALGLAVAVGGIVAAVSLTKNSNPKFDGGILADESTITAATNFGHLTNNSKYTYTDTNGTEKQQTVTTASADGSLADPFVIDSIARFQFFVNVIDTDNATYRDKVFYISTDLDFGNQTITHSAFPEQGFAGKLYGGKHIIKNAVYSGVEWGTKTYVMGLITHTAPGATFADFSIDPTCTVNRTADVGTAGYMTIVGGVVGMSTGSIYFQNCSTYANMTYKNTNTTLNGAKAILSMGGFVGYLQRTSEEGAYTDCVYFYGCNCLVNIEVTGVTQPSSGDKLPSNACADNSIRYAGVAGTTEILGIEANYLNINITTKQHNAGGGAGVIFPSGSLNKVILQNCFMKHEASYDGLNTSTDINVITYNPVICSETHRCNINVDHCYVITNLGASMIRNGRTDDLIIYNKAAANNNHNHDTLYPTSNEIYGPSFIWNNGLDGYGKPVLAGKPTLSSEAAVVTAAQKDTSLTSKITVNDDATGVIKGSAVAESNITYYCGLCATEQVATGKYNPSVDTTINSGHTHTGLTFDGWGIGGYEASGVIKNKIPAYSRMGDLKLYAKWTINAPTETKTNATNVVYADNEKTTISVKLTGLNTSLTKVTSGNVSWKGPDGKAVASTTATPSWDADTYTASLTFTRPTVAMSGNYTCTYKVIRVDKYDKKGIKELSRSVTLTLTVTPKVVAAPQMVKNDFVYTGGVQGLQWTPGSDGIPTGYPAGGAANSPLYTVGGQPTATNANASGSSYNVTFTLADNKNYCWGANDNAARNMTWTIAKATIADDDIEFSAGENGIVGLPLNGAAQTITNSTVAKFLFAGATDKTTLEGTTNWKNNAELISYKDFTEEMFAGTGAGEYKTKIIFTPTDTNIAAYEGEITLKVTGQYITVADRSVDPVTGENADTSAATKIWLDRGQTAKIAPSFTAEASGKKYATITYYQGGVAKTAKVEIQAPAGYSPKVYFVLGGNDNTNGITANAAKSEFTLDFVGTTSLYGKAFLIGYEPAEVTYSVYYVLESANGTVTKDGSKYAFDTTATKDELDLGLGEYLFKATVTGTTTNFVTYLDNSYNYYTTIADVDHYELHNAANAHLDELRIAGDGSTVAVVYLKAKSYVVTFLAVGASSNSTQTQTVKYKAKVDTSKLLTPAKKGAIFDNWYTAQTGGSLANLATRAITDATTFYARFISSEYYVVFDMNSFEASADTTLKQYGINLNVVPKNAEGKEIGWDINTLFGAFGDDFFLATSDDQSGKWTTGDYVFRYTVDNLTSNLSLSKPLPSAISYNFSGWYNESGSQISTITAPRNISGSPAEVTRLTARWTSQTYRLVFDRLDGSRTTTKTGVANLSNWTSILNTTALSAPTRNGYTFEGWFATADLSGSKVEEMGTAGIFSVFDYAELYGEDGVYDFSTIKIYAKWESVPVLAEIVDGLTGGYIDYIDVEHTDGEQYDDNIVHFGDTVEAVIVTYSGYKFSHLVVGKRNRAIYPKASAQSEEETLSFVVASSDVDMENNKLVISAVFTEVTFTISYDRDGGSYVGSASVPRTYKISQEENGSISLPSDMVKLGYDFGGWVFDKAVDENGDELFDVEGDRINGQYAFVTDELDTTASLNGETLTLSSVVISRIDTEETKWYADFTLKAKWIAQKATVRLYGASYEVDDGYGSPTNGCYEFDSLEGDDLTTASEITIKSPVSSSFYFVGWATERNGEIMYAAELKEVGYDDVEDVPLYEAQPVTYTLNASKALNGSDTHANDLYAVWQIKSISYVNVSAANNNSVYNGTGIKLSGRTARAYEDDPNAGSIKITYNWYRVKDTEVGEGTKIDYYARVFNVSKKIYIDEYGVEVGTVVYGEGGSKTFYKADGTPVSDEADIATDNFIEEKSINVSELEGSCVRKATVTRAGATLASPVEYTVRSVSEAGRYICVAQLEGSDAVAFGEINVTMKKAQFSGVVLQSAIKPYNGDAQGIEVELTNTNGVKLEGNVITLSDVKTEDGSPNGTKITVTYKYKVDGTTTQATDSNGYLIDENGKWLQSVTNAGKYNVTACFEITDDKGNYTVIESLSADFEITKRQLTNIGFTVEHEVEEGKPAFVNDGKYRFTYDGNVYVVGAEIKDTDADNKPIVSSSDDLAVKVNIYTADESGNKTDPNPITVNGGNALNAGYYIAEIPATGGLVGASNVNYQIGNITRTQLFEITKAKRDYGISFEDAEVTFDNKPHTISITSNEELPSTITVSYSVVATLEDERLKTYTTDSKYKANNVYLSTDDVAAELVGKAITNGGRHAGTYVVTVTFTDSESSNYEPIQVEPATLTIKKANLFEFYSDDGTAANGLQKLVTDYGFESALDLAYETTANRIRFIGSTTHEGAAPCMLTSKDYAGNNYFDITYNVYKVTADNKRGDGLASGSQASLADVIIREPGTYEMEAVITYTSPLYSNNFAEITNNPTIRIKISEGEIESIKVNYNKSMPTVMYVGDAFDMSYIANVELRYKNNNTPVTLSGAQLAALKVIYGGDHETFWKVGESVQLVFEIYGTKTSTTDGDPLAEGNRFKVMQKITSAVLKCSQDGVNYVTVPEHGLDVEEANNYQYRIYYNCVDASGATVEKWTAVTAKNLVRGINDNVTVLTETAEEGTANYFALTLATESLYDFSELEFALTVYKSVSGDDVTWKYLTDEGWVDIDTETWVLPYKGEEYEVRAYFAGEDDVESYAETSVTQGSIRNYQSSGYTVKADEYTDGENYESEYKYYRLNGIQIDRLAVARYTLSFVWENDNEDFENLVYKPDTAQRIKLVTSGVLDSDLGDIDFTYSFEKLTKNADGEVVNRVAVSESSIKDAGNYRIIVSKIVLKDGGDAAKLSNYLLPEDNGQDFEILKATIQIHEIYYEESGTGYNYGKNISYENNPQGLRTDKLMKDWGDYAQVAGQLNFVYKDSETGEYRVYANDSDMSSLLKVANSPVQVGYMYSPSDKANYEILYGTVSITIETPVATNRLNVVRKTGAADYYIVDQYVGTDRIDVYRLYSSYYKEGTKEYGYQLKVDSQQYTVKANGQDVTSDYRYKVDPDDTKILVEVEMKNSSASGSLEFRVFASQPTSLTLATSQTIKNTWYVGEAFNLDGVTFNLHFREGEVVPVTFAELEYSFDGTNFESGNHRFTIDDADAETIKVVFRYAGLTTNDQNSITINVKPKEDLKIVTNFSKTVTLKFGEAKVPQLQFSVDGETVTEIEGVSYTTKITKVKDGSVVEGFDEEGTYRIEYTFNPMTNPRFRDITTKSTLTVDVKTIAYEVVFNEFTAAQLTSVYSGSKVTPPVASVSKVLDLTNNDAEVDLPVTVKVTSVDTVTDSSKWNILNVKSYVIVTTAYLYDEEIGSTTYTYRVTRAKNSASLTAKNILVGGEASYEVSDLHFGTFDAETMITFSSNPDSGFTSTVPTRVGTWYVMLLVPGTTNYEELKMVVKFTISNKSLSSNKDNDGNVLVEVDGGNKGIAPGTVLGVEKVDEDTLSGLKLKNQNVHDGYDVTLKDAAGNDTELEDDVTIKLLITEDLRGSDNKLGVYRVTVDANGKTKTEEVKNVKVSEDGKYLVFSASSVGRFVVTEKLPTAPVGLVAGVSVGAVVATALIVACVLVFLKKRK